jgi:hypothetical protein
MSEQKVVRVFGLVLLVFIVIVAGGQVVLQLWNWLIPGLFGLPPLTFWKALGLLALCRVLFGGWGGFHPRRSDWRHRMRERMEHMTPEERDRMRQRMGYWCGVPKQQTEPKP